MPVYEPTTRHLLKEFLDLPRFEDGRINYSGAKKAPVLVVFVEYNNKILLLKRSEKVYAYRGLWASVAGFIDEEKSLSEKVCEELREELTIPKNDIQEFIWGEPYEYMDKALGKTWIRVPVKVLLKKLPQIKLDFEHTEYIWVKPKDISFYKLIPGLIESLEKVS